MNLDINICPVCNLEFKLLFDVWVFPFCHTHRAQPRALRQGEVMQHSGRSFGLYFGFSYMFYTFKLSVQNTENREKWATFEWLFLPNHPIGWALHLLLARHDIRVQIYICPFVSPSLFQRFTLTLVVKSVIAAICKPCIMLVLNIALQHTLWPGAINLYTCITL